MRPPADDRLVEERPPEIVIEAPLRTVADPREQEQWFRNLPPAKQDELRETWVKDQVHADRWSCGARRARRYSARDCAVIMVLVLLMTNPACIGFVGYAKILIGGAFGGAGVGWAAESLRAQRGLTAALGGIGFYVTQSVLFSAGSFVALFGGVVAAVAFMANGVIREFRYPGD